MRRAINFSLYPSLFTLLSQKCSSSTSASESAPSFSDQLQLPVSPEAFPTQKSCPESVFFSTPLASCPPRFQC